MEEKMLVSPDLEQQYFSSEDEKISFKQEEILYFKRCDELIRLNNWTYFELAVILTAERIPEGDEEGDEVRHEEVDACFLISLFNVLTNRDEEGDEEGDEMGDEEEGDEEGGDEEEGDEDEEGGEDNEEGYYRVE